MPEYLVREAIAPIARRRIRAARRQETARRKKAQLSVLIDRDTLDRFRAYCAERQDDDNPMSMAERVEELLDRQMRKKVKRS